MAKIDTKDWGEFQIGKLFNTRRGERQRSADRMPGKIPYYSASSSNNGLTDMIGNPTFVEENKLIVTTFLDVYYVKGVFSASDEITILDHKNLNEENALFIATCIKALKWKYNFTLKAFSTRLKKDMIYLPKDFKGEPDWDYMELFIKTQKKTVLKNYQRIMSVNYSENKLDTSNWGEFQIKDIFPIIKRPAKRSISDYFPGDVPYVTSGNYDNAVDSYLEPLPNEELEKGNCISVSPVDGSTFYQPVDFLGRGGGGSSIMLLYNEHLNEYNGLFVSSIIQSFLGKKYAFGDMGNSTTIKEELIKLPQKVNGEPDWGYMDDYIRIRIKEAMTTIRKINPII